MDTKLLSRVNNLNKDEMYFELMHNLIQISGCKSGYFAELVHDNSIPNAVCKVLISDISEVYSEISLIEKFDIPYYTHTPYYITGILTIPLVIDDVVIGVIGLGDGEFNESFLEKYKYFFDYMTLLLSAHQPLNETKLFQMISSAQQLYLSTSSKEDTFDNLLKGIVKLTCSEYGFIGEYNDTLACLATLAVTKKGPEILFNGLDTIVYKYREVLISNEVESEHSPLRKFCGMPFFFDNKFMGIVCIANPIIDFNKDIVSKLEPFLTSCASLINNIHNELEREEIQQINKSFISQIIHELKTPLNSILGFAQLLKIECDSEFINHIITGGNNLMTLIHDSLNLNSIDEYNINYTYIPIHKYFQDEINNSINSIKKLNITVHNNLDKNLSVYCDLFLLDRIVKNLLSNAIKYNTMSGDLIISNKFIDDTLFISIKNSGILKIKSQNLFMPFCTSNRDGGGTGLGLSITKSIFDILNESINVNIPADDQVEFIFSIKYKISTTKKILYIEDNIMNQILMKNILKDYDIEIKDHANNILEYINDYDVLLIDLYLENSNGLDAIKLLRENNIIIPIVLITASTDIDTRRQLHDLGIKCINKPLRITILQEYIKSIL
jgi:CheY-like chemotaxis protein